MLIRLLKEPLTHFLILGSVLYAYFDLSNPDLAKEAEHSITVTQDDQARLAQQFASTWKRLPAPEELKNLVEEYIREEILYREAKKLGMDQNDTVVRQRMRQKLEFMTSASLSEVTPTETQLIAHLESNHDFFSIPAQIQFQHIFIGEHASNTDIDMIQQQLNDGAELNDLRRYHASFMMPTNVRLTSVEEVSKVYGPDFKDALLNLETGLIHGPIESTHGLHFVQVQQFQASTLPDIELIRGKLTKHWLYQQVQEQKEAQYQAYKANYDIVVEPEGLEQRPQKEGNDA